MGAEPESGGDIAIGQFADPAGNVIGVASPSASPTASTDDRQCLGELGRRGAAYVDALFTATNACEGWPAYCGSGSRPPE